MEGILWFFPSILFYDFFSNHIDPATKSSQEFVKSFPLELSYDASLVRVKPKWKILSSRIIYELQTCVTLKKFINYLAAVKLAILEECFIMDNTFKHFVKCLL